MITTGQTISNPASGGLGIVLNVREIAQTADGSVLAEYEAIEVKPGTQTASSNAPYGIAGEAGSGLRTRIVDPRTLTEAQAVASGVSRSEYRAAREASDEQAESNSTGPKNPADLSAAEKADIARLQARDSAVKQEEKAHAAAAGPYGSAPQYEYQIGPDGKAYAIGGHVDVGVSLSGSAEDTDRALATLQNAALAPNAPSGADMSAFRQASLQRATTDHDEPKPIPGYGTSKNDANDIFSIYA
ncbi:putative metalloprotease CJM1_0395 family protein [Thalassospira australica]|uniref:putative metalloprotease CJM1_0395 family protein n=1 Tax=Thalassospira australica TaxID=1528106 RepID=UPI00384C99A5